MSESKIYMKNNLAKSINISENLKITDAELQRAQCEVEEDGQEGRSLVGTRRWQAGRHRLRKGVSRSNSTRVWIWWRTHVRNAHHPNTEASVSGLLCGGCNSIHGRVSYTDGHTEHPRNRTRCTTTARKDLSAAAIIPGVLEHVTDSEIPTGKKANLTSPKLPKNDLNGACLF